MKKYSKDKFVLLGLISIIVILIFIYILSSAYYIEDFFEKVRTIEMWWPCILGVITIIILSVKYEYILNKELKEFIELIFENIKNNIAIKFKESEFKDDEEKAIAREDCEAFSSYDAYAQDNNDIYSEYCVEFDDIFKFSYKNDNIFLLYTEFETINMRGKSYYYEKNLMYEMIKETNLEKRLHIRVKENCDAKAENFEDVFEDLKENVLEYDKKYIKDLKFALNKEYNKTIENNDYLELTENQKEFLLDLYNKTNLKFSLVLDYKSIRSEIIVPKVNNIIDIEKVIENVSQFFIEIIENYSEIFK